MLSSERKIREFERREQDILSAALELFAGERWESVTVTQIAEQAGIGKGTVYKHFASKDEIYARLALDFYYGLLECSLQVPVSDDPAADMGESFRSALRYHQQNQQYSNVRQYVFRAGFWERLSRSYVEAFEKLDAEFSAWANNQIERGMKTGQFRVQPLPTVRAGLDALFNGAVAQLWGNRCWMQIDPNEYIEQVVAFAMNALIAKQGKYK